MKNQQVKSAVSKFLVAVVAVCFAASVQASPVHGLAADTGKMSKMDHKKMDKMSKMDHKKMDKMSKMDHKKMDKMSHGKMAKDSSKM